MKDLLSTPIHIKRAPDLAWPDESTFYIVSRDGLFICRNHDFFRSCAPARTWPCELAGQREFLEPRYPKVPRALFERVVGFFARVGEESGAEAAVLLVWDKEERRVRAIIPEQEGTVSRGYSGSCYPVDLHYTVPTDLPPHQVIFGDIHSHVDLAAYASATDIADEKHRPGLHIVVGRIFSEPPQIHIEAVVDGTRFRLGRDEVLEGYQRRNADVPQAWIDKVKVKEEQLNWYYAGDGGGSTRS